MRNTTSPYCLVLVCQAAANVTQLLSLWKAHLKVLQLLKTPVCNPSQSSAFRALNPGSRSCGVRSSTLGTHTKNYKECKNQETKADEGKQTQTPVSFFSYRATQTKPCVHPTAAGKQGMPETSPSRYWASCTPITLALPLILRGNINTLMAAPFFTSCVYKHRVC